MGPRARRRSAAAGFLVAPCLLLTSCAGGSSSPAANSGGVGASTVQTVLQPVDAAGNVNAGWTVEEENSPVECDGVSPASQSGNVFTCSPTAASADTCWKQSDAYVLCLRDPFVHKLTRLAAIFGTIAVATGKPVPLGLIAVNGVHCRLRNGGAWPDQKADPRLLGAYSCDSGDAVFARDGVDAVDTSASQWFSLIGSFDGAVVNQPLQEAIFVR